MLKVDIIIAIPTKEASPAMLPLVKDLRRAGFRKIVIVNDGCDPSCDPVFETAREDYNCDILQHAVHLGKGRSLKTAFNYILETYPQCSGVITVDDMGRHCIEEVEQCAAEMSVHPDDLILGCRDFTNVKVPWGAKLNNKLTRALVRILTGIDVTDTSTGLRGMNKELMKQFLNCQGEGQDFELNMLLECKAAGIRIREFNTEVEYVGQDIEDPEYNPLIHSGRIYVVFVRYCITSVVATVLDFILFTTAIASLKWRFPSYYIVFSTIIARVLSGLLNFYLSKNTVFRNKDDAKPMIWRFFMIAALQMLLSAVFVTLLYKIMPITETFVKLIVDAILFIVFYQVQREWVFTSKEQRPPLLSVILRKNPESREAKQ